ncbi:MAG: thioredoxin family protein [Smithella sp.]
MKIEILGMGCTTCNKLEDAVRLAVKETGIDAQIDHIADIKKIMTYGVMTTPALVIDGKVVAAGKLPTLADIKKMIGGS